MPGFAGRDWVDNEWPVLPVLADSQHADDPDVLLQIREKLQTAAV